MRKPHKLKAVFSLDNTVSLIYLENKISTDYSKNSGGTK